MLHNWIALCVLLQGMCSVEPRRSHYSQCLQDSLQNQTLQLQPCNSSIDLQRWAWEDGGFLVNEGSGRCLTGSRSTTPCDRSSVLHWHCHGHRLTSLGGSVELWGDRGFLLLSPRRGTPRSESTGNRNACKAKMRSRRTSGDPEDQHIKDPENTHQATAKGVMTEEQKAFLKWYYRTEDPSSWKYAMLALSFGALLLGSVLLAIGIMANRSKRKLAALAAQIEELQGLTGALQADAPNNTQTPDDSQILQVSHPNGKTPKEIQTPPESIPPQVGEPPNSSEPPHESETLQISESPQESETPQISEPPQESETPQISEAPQQSETSQISESAQERETANISESAQESETTKISESAQESETPQISKPPQESETPQISEPRQESETPQITESPQESETLQISKPPQESETPQISEPRQESETPQIIESPQESETSQISEPSQESETPQISELPQESEASQISEPPQESETPQISELPQESEPPPHQ